MRRAVVTLEALGAALVLAPERHLARASRAAGRTVLGDLVVERRERVRESDLAEAVVLDTTHARDGLVDVLAALRTVGSTPRSGKRRARAGDVLVSRLRPYLRQIALVTPELTRLLGERPIACSPEFVVLSPRAPGESIAWVVPHLLSPGVQEALARGQEGGHHPRVPLETLLGLPVPETSPPARTREGASVCAAAAQAYGAAEAWARLTDPEGLSLAQRSRDRPRRRAP